MRRFLTLVCLFVLALPAGVSISGCTRNPAGNYCNGLGYGLKDTDVDYITLQPQIGGISLAYGQIASVQSPTAYTCKGNSTAAPGGKFNYGTTNNQLVDISPTGRLCAGTWNRNTGGGIADYTYCYAPSPLPATGGLPYAIAYITATTAAVTSNPVPVYVHAPITSISLATTPLDTSSSQSCFSQNQQASLDALAYYDNNGTESLLCQPSSNAPVTGFSVNNNVVTLNAANNFVAGEMVTFSGLSAATFLNGKTWTVLSNGLSNTQFEVAANAANASQTADNGAAATSSALPTCGNSIGTLSFASSNSSIANINPATLTDPLSTITALMPGTTTITATISQSASSAGYFSTCPPAAIKVALANGSTSGVITQGVTQNLTTTVTDTLGKPITGLDLTYESTNPIEVAATAGGAITTAYPGLASVYAVCEPPGCNPAPINVYGLNGTGLSLASNPVDITVPGTTSDFVYFAAPGLSRYFSSMQLLTGNPGGTTLLPYVPNSLVMDQQGANLYFGSLRELMIYSTSADAITRQDASVPGVVLAASPNASQLLINDQVRGLFYIYNTAGSIATTYSGMGSSAAWTPDSQTLYIADSSSLGGNHTNTLYVYNANVGWSTYTLTNPTSASVGRNLAITVPGVGAYLTGNPTVDHTWCPSGNVGNNGSILFYPQSASDVLNLQTDVIGATLDGKHMLGAALSGSNITLNDIAVDISAAPLCPVDTAVSPQTMSPLSTNPSINGTVTLGTQTGAKTFAAAQVNQVVTGTAPATATVTTAAPIAFVTYNGDTAGNQLPYYLPQSSGLGQVGYVTFADANSTTAPPTAPLTGAFSPDHSLFFVSTAGDNEIHFISIPDNVSTTAPPTDSQQYSPNLPACTPVSAGGNDADCLYPTAPTATTYVPATVIVVKPRSIT